MAVRLILAFALTLGGLATPMLGQDDPEPDPPRWKITPYLWVPEIAGSSSSDGEEASGPGGEAHLVSLPERGRPRSL